MLRALLRFYKNWALPISMVMGVVLYFVYTSLPFLKGTSHLVNSAHISSVEDDVLMVHSMAILISRRRKKECLEKLAMMLGGVG